MEQFETMLREVQEFERRNGIEVVLQESLPRSDGKQESEAFARLGLSKASYAALAKPVTIDEAKKDAKVVLPEGTHRKLAEALGAESLVPDGMHAKLASAL